MSRRNAVLPDSLTFSVVTAAPPLLSVMVPPRTAEGWKIQGLSVQIERPAIDRQPARAKGGGARRPADVPPVTVVPPVRECWFPRESMSAAVFRKAAAGSSRCLAAANDDRDRVAGRVDHRRRRTGTLTFTSTRPLSMKLALSTLGMSVPPLRLNTPCEAPVTKLMASVPPLRLYMPSGAIAADQNKLFPALTVPPVCVKVLETGRRFVHRHVAIADERTAADGVVPLPVLLPAMPMVK